MVDIDEFGIFVVEIFVYFFFFFFAWNKIIRRLAKFILVSLRNLLELCKASY